MAPILGQWTPVSVWHRDQGAQALIHSLRQRARPPWLAKTEDQGGGLSDFLLFLRSLCSFWDPGGWREAWKGLSLDLVGLVHI